MSVEKLSQALNNVLESQPCSFNIAPLLDTIPPIEGEFDAAKEVGRLLKLPKGERRDALTKFKRNLAHQREAWAACRVCIENQIELYPETPREGLVGILKTFADKYGFASRHVQIAESLIDDCIELRNRVQRCRAQYPDDLELIQKVCGVSFKEDDRSDIKLTTGPICFVITCSGFNTGRLFERFKNTVVRFRYGGFAAKTSYDSGPVYYIVINRDYELILPAYYKSTYWHEIEHLKNSLLRARMPKRTKTIPTFKGALNSDARGSFRHRTYEGLLDMERVFAIEALEEYERATDPRVQKYFLYEYMIMSMYNALDLVKGELLAMKAETRAGFYRENYNLFTHDFGYDYLKDIREREDKKHDPLWQEVASEILVNKYHQIINRAIASYDELIEEGYPTEVAIAMLTDVDLADWPKTIRRVLEQRRKAVESETETKQHVSAII